MKKLALLAVLALTLGIGSIAKSATFMDVPEGHWAADAVQKLADAGLVVGYEDGTYRGKNPMTRYEYAMIVDRMMKWIDQNYCAKGNSECKGAAAIDTSKFLTKEDMDEAKAMVEKLAAEFKDELAALKKQVQQNTDDIAGLNKKIDNLPGASVKISGSLRQRIDAPHSDLDVTRLTNVLAALHGLTITSKLNAGYEALPRLQFDDNKMGNNTDWSVALSRAISNNPFSSANPAVVNTNGTMGDLTVEHAWMSIDLTKDIRELDLFKITSGYQPVAFGPYGALVDNKGIDSQAGVRFDVAKDIVSVGGFAGLAQGGTNGVSGLGSTVKDLYAAFRLGVDIKPLDTMLGVNFLASGIMKEKGWGVDIESKLLKNTPFLTGLRGEYLKMTKTALDADPTATTVGTAGRKARDYSYVVGLDVYKTKKAGLTLSYADLPIAPAFTGLDISPLTEYDATCPLIGLDVAPVACINREGGRDIFPAGFKGFGAEASYIVLGNVELNGAIVLGDYAGGTLPATYAFAGTDARGRTYPGFGKLSVTKPINDNAKFRVEYLQQGRDPILVNRVRGELLINF